MSAETLVEEVWNIKKIILTLVTVTSVVGGGYAVKTNLIDQHTPPAKSGGVVEGANTQNTTPLSTKTPASQLSSEIKNSANQQLDSIKQQIQNINPAEIATSSPQVQQIIKEINSVGDTKNQAKQACENICNGL